MTTPTLSYIITTYNKLAFLSVTLPLLIEYKKQDEEIVVVDGGSTDGTVEYLQQLLNEKKIDQFVSEKDAGEAHGTNKAFLMARAEIIKLITDDDIYFYPAVTECKKFMIANKNIDILGFDGFGLNINQNGYAFEKVNYIEGFKKWKKDKTPFLFCGLSYMMRKSSFAYMGLFDTKFKIVDIEYSIRVSSMNTKIAFYTGLAYVNIVNPQSNSHKYYRTIDNEKKILLKIYPSLKSTIGTRSLNLRFREFVSEKVLKKSAPDPAFDYKIIVQDSIQLLTENQQNRVFEFLQ